MNNKLPDHTPVRHKTEGYKGWINGITKMEDLFTGNTDCQWQYRILLSDGKQRKIAPPEDLEAIADAAEFPPFILDTKLGKNKKFNEESQLHALGYNISDLNSEERWDILVNVAIPILGVTSVVKTIISLASLRCRKIESAKKYIYSLTEWYNDIENIFKEYKDNEELNTSSAPKSFKMLKTAMLKHGALKEK